MSARRPWWCPWLCAWLVGCARGGPGAADEAVTPPEAAVAQPAQAAREPHEAEPAPLRLVEVAPGIHAVLQPAAWRFADANGALVVTDAGVVVIDGSQRLAPTQWLMARAQALGEAPRRVLVTTHWHLDHSLAAAWWATALEREGGALELWGHAELSPHLAAEGLGQLEERRAALSGAIERGTAMQASGHRQDGTPLTADERTELRAELHALRTELRALEGVTLRPPTHPVREPTTLALGSVTLELIPLQAHTEADLVVHVPAAGVLITGDVLDEIPFGGHGRPRRWLAALRRLAALHPTTIIPGHGPVLGPEHLDRMIALWDALLGQAMLAIQRGEEPAQRYAAWETTAEHQALREALCTDAVSERAFATFMPEALARAMADLRGDLDPPPGAR